MTTLPSSNATMEISDAEFDAFAEIAKQSAGLSIPKSKKTLVQSRVARRLRSLKMASPREYLALVTQDNVEKRELVSVLTTNVSSFLREAHHFEFLRKTVLPHLQTRLDQGHPVRIWSAGCSSGQEPYSIAIELAKAMPNCFDQDVLILASDIDPAILNQGQKGQYSAEELAPLDAEDTSTFFDPAPGSDDQFLIHDSIKNLVRFRELNLHGPWPMKNGFDAIFCRNVVIYFDDEHQRGLWPRFRNQLTDPGWLFLGHSERIHDAEHIGFKPAGITVYQRS